MIALCPARTEPLIARLRLAHLIGSADIAPAGFPPQAILFVRRLTAPGKLSLGSILPERFWEQSAREVLTSLYRRAVRASRGVIPNSAEAVIFVDMAELLACLGIAVESRTVEREWYWRALLKEHAVSSAAIVEMAWIEQPRFVPAAFEYLVKCGYAARVLRCLSEQQVGRILEKIIDEFNLPSVAPRKAAQNPRSAQGPPMSEFELERSHFEAPIPTARREREDRSQLERRGFRAPSGAASEPPFSVNRRSPPPWVRWCPQAGSSYHELPVVTQHLLGISVALFHAPTVARSKKFAREIGDWIESSLGPAVEPNRSAQSARHEPARAVAEPDRISMESGSAIPFEDQEPPNPPVVAPAEITPRANNKVEKREASPSSKPAGRSSTPSTASRRSNRERTARQTRHRETTTPSAPAERNVIESAEPPLSRDQWEALEGVDTRIGGVLCLLNLVLCLDLPECFDDESGLSDHISSWGVTELLGREFLRALDESFDDDNLWKLLEQLDGRNSGDTIAPGLNGDSDYRIPVKWLERFFDGPHEWVVVPARRRLVIRDQTVGYPVIDVSVNGANRKVLETNEVARYRGEGLEIRLIHAPRAPGLHRWRASSAKGISYGQARVAPLKQWISRVFPFVRHVLFRAIGEEGMDDSSFARMLIKHGRVYCTTTHLDLVMGLNDISLPFRRAGLDLNPGWVPDLMRVVSFHFS
jgi:hypothetical protein